MPSYSARYILRLFAKPLCLLWINRRINGMYIHDIRCIILQNEKRKSKEIQTKEIGINRMVTKKIAPDITLKHYAPWYYLKGPIIVVPFFALYVKLGKELTFEKYARELILILIDYVALTKANCQDFKERYFGTLTTISCAYHNDKHAKVYDFLIFIAIKLVLIYYSNNKERKKLHNAK